MMSRNDSVKSITNIFFLFSGCEGNGFFHLHGGWKIQVVFSLCDALEIIVCGFVLADYFII